MKIEVYSPTIKRKEMDAVLTAMVEDRIGPGEHTQFLIHTAKEYLGFDYCLALRSPAFALQLALEALNLEPGKGVIVSALSPLYYDRVIRSLGLTPLYCDTTQDSPCMAGEKIEAFLGSTIKPGCVVYHETLGYSGGPINSGIDPGIPVIVDISESFGTVPAEETGQNAKTSWPVPATFTILGLEERNMLTAGGGALLFSATRRDASILRGLGELPPEYSLPDINAAMAAVQFRESGKNISRRAEIAGAYIKSSLQTRHRRFIQHEGIEYNNYAFALVLETGVKDVKAYAKKKEILVEEAFGLSLAGSGVIPPSQCPAASSLALRTVLFPLYPRLGASRAARVAKLIMTLP